jgi:hypothetical protein
MAACANSTAETFFAARAADMSAADVKLHCDAAKISLLLYDCGVMMPVPARHARTRWQVAVAPRPR